MRRKAVASCTALRSVVGISEHGLSRVVNDCRIGASHSVVGT